MLILEDRINISPLAPGQFVPGGFRIPDSEVSKDQETSGMLRSVLEWFCLCCSSQEEKPRELLSRQIAELQTPTYSERSSGSEKYSGSEVVFIGDCAMIFPKESGEECGLNFFYNSNRTFTYGT